MWYAGKSPDKQWSHAPRWLQACLLHYERDRKIMSQKGMAAVCVCMCVFLKPTLDCFLWVYKTYHNRGGGCDVHHQTYKSTRLSAENILNSEWKFVWPGRRSSPNKKTDKILLVKSRLCEEAEVKQALYASVQGNIPASFSDSAA